MEKKKKKNPAEYELFLPKPLTLLRRAAISRNQ